MAAAAIFSLPGLALPPTAQLETATTDQMAGTFAVRYLQVHAVVLCVSSFAAEPFLPSRATPAKVVVAVCIVVTT